MRRRRQRLEFAVGAGLLLGPLVFALTLPQPSAEPVVCEAELPPEVVVVEVCAHEATPEPEQAPEQAPAPEPVPEQAPEPEQAPPPPLEGASAFLFVTDNGLVLSTEADPAWGKGRLYEPAGEATYRVAKRANTAALPAELLAQRGRSFDLYGRDGKVCSARIGGLHVINQYDGWSLDGVLGDDIWETYEDPEDIPKRMWRNGLWASAGHWLVADIDSDESCEGALWARDASLPAPMLLQPSSHETTEGKARIAQFEGSDELTQTRADYQAWYTALDPEAREYEPTWASMAEQNPASVTSWLDDTKQVRLVEFDFGENFGGCGDGFDARVTALELVRGDSFEDTEQYADVTAIFDADLDGELEYLYVDGDDWWSMTLNSQSESLDVSVSIERDFECPC